MAPKAPFNEFTLGFSLFLNAAFLFLSLIQLAAAAYAGSDGEKEHFIQDFLLFRESSAIWGAWRSIEQLGLVPLFVFATVKDFIGIATSTATKKRNFLDFISFFHLGSVIYVVIAFVAPLEHLLIKGTNGEQIQTLTYFYWFSFAMNVVGVFLTIGKYTDYAANSAVYLEGKEKAAAKGKKAE